MLLNLFREKRFKMFYIVKKGDNVNYLSGTAHFFPYSFRRSLSELISRVDTVLFEGPLDESDMEKVISYGYENSQESSLFSMVSEEARRILSQELDSLSFENDSEIYRYLGYLRQNGKTRLEMEIEGLRPWMAFFKIWTSYLRKRGWVYSVDLEAHAVAKEQKKEIHYLETIEEQILALEGVPLEKIVNFLNMCSKWEKFAKKHADFYLKGDLDFLLGSTSLFPTRCESIIDKRDPVLFERMLPYFERGSSAAFVGITHLKGITEKLKGKGYSVFKGL